MNEVNEVNERINKILNQLLELFITPEKVTTKLELYQSFFSDINQFAKRYELITTDEWKQVDQWLIHKSTEYLPPDEATHLKRAIEPLRIKAISYVLSKIKHYEYDVFISHAHANKNEFVDSFTKGLSKLGISIWYDTMSIDWGDSQKKQIYNGLQKCRFGIVVISPEFLGREWTEKELNELLQRQNESGQKVVLPLLYHYTIGEMKERYPGLADFNAKVLSSNDDIKGIVIDFARVLIHALKNENSL